MECLSVGPMSSHHQEKSKFSRRLISVYYVHATLTSTNLFFPDGEGARTNLWVSRLNSFSDTVILAMHKKLLPPSQFVVPEIEHDQVCEECVITPNNRSNGVSYKYFKRTLTYIHGVYS